MIVGAIVARKENLDPQLRLEKLLPMFVLFVPTVTSWIDTLIFWRMFLQRMPSRISLVTYST